MEMYIQKPSFITYSIVFGSDLEMTNIPIVMTEYATSTFIRPNSFAENLMMYVHFLLVINIRTS